MNIRDPRIKSESCMEHSRMQRKDTHTMSIELDNCVYYEASFLKEKVPTYFIGCSATINKIIEKKNIPNEQYIFASYSKVRGWNRLPQDSAYKVKKLLITKVWVESNVPGFIKIDPKSGGKTNVPVNKYEDAPPLLYLEDHEQFRDEKGNIIEIEVRGERHHEKIWFKAKDVGNMLEVDKIRNTLTNSQTNFIEGKHYQSFVVQNLIRGGAHIVGCPTNEQKELKISMFLSYSGLVRLLFVRQHPIAEKFQKWALEKLFAMQYGTKDQKEELAADVLGISIKAVKAFLNTSATAMPAVYLFYLGKVKDLRETFDIPASFSDDQSVYKYGLSRDLRLRAEQHDNGLGKLPGVTMNLKYHVYIDPLLVQEAENEIKKYFKIADWHINHPKYTEIVSVPDRFINNMVHNEFKRLGQTYSGKLQDLQQKLQFEQDTNNLLKDQMANIERASKEKEALYTQLLQQEKENSRMIMENNKLLLAEKEKRLIEKDNTIQLYMELKQRS